MTPPKNEVLTPYFSQKEIKELETNKPDKYKELLEKLKLSENKTQVELNALKQELDNLTLDEKVDRLLDFTKKSKEKNEPSKQEEKKAKKEAEDKWFSWEKITKIVEEKWGWFSWAWFTTGISAFFSNFFGNLFDSAKEGASELIDNAEEKIDWVISKYTNESEWTFNKDTYSSKLWKFNIEFSWNREVKKITINWEDYKLDENFTLENQNWENYLVSSNLWIKSKYNLNYIWHIIDNKKFSNSFDDISIRENNTKEMFNVIPDDWELWNRDLVFMKNDSLAKKEKNTISVWNTIIEFNKEINSDKIEEIEIKEIKILWKRYYIEPIWTKFSLEKDWFSYSLQDKIFITIGQDKIKLRDISKKIKNKTDKWYILLNENIWGKNNTIYLKEMK